MEYMECLRLLLTEFNEGQRAEAREFCEREFRNLLRGEICVLDNTECLMIKGRTTFRGWFVDHMGCSK